MIFCAQNINYGQNNLNEYVGNFLIVKKLFFFRTKKALYVKISMCSEKLKNKRKFDTHNYKTNCKKH